MQTTIKTRIYHPNAGLPELIADDPDTLGVAKTLRLHPNDQIACFNGDGMENIYSILSVEKRLLTAKRISQQPNPRDPKLDLTILLASTKGKTKDQMVKELTALGATRVLLYHAQRSVSLPEEKQTERLQKIAIESCRQCERSTIPKVDIIPKELHQLDSEIFGNTPICFYEKTSPEDLPQLSPSDQSVTLIYGPEGGFTDQEFKLLKTKNTQFCSLGRRILRAELAVSVGTSIVQYQRNVI